MKKTELNLMILSGIFIAGILVSNLFGGKLMQLGGFLLPSALFIYPITYLVTDVIGEIWGKKTASNTAKAGLIMQLLFIILSFIGLSLPTFQGSVEIQEHLNAVFMQGLRVTVASLAAFCCSQFLDVFLFHKLKERCNGKKKWLRNNISTMASQMVDTIVFITVAFAGAADNLLLMIAAQYIAKLCLALLDTPFFYFLTRERGGNEIKERDSLGTAP